MEPEPQDYAGVQMQRAPIAAPQTDGKPDLLQQLQIQQMERMQLAVQFLTTPLVRSQPKDKKIDYLKKQLHVSEAELGEAFKQAQDTLVQPAVEFLQHEKVQAQPLGRRVSYLKQKLGLNDIDIEEAFRRIGDAEAPPFFKASRISAAVTFLTNPALKNRPGDAKVKYLKHKLQLSDEEVKVSSITSVAPPHVCALACRSNLAGDFCRKLSEKSSNWRCSKPIAVKLRRLPAALLPAGQGSPACLVAQMARCWDFTRVGQNLRWWATTGGTRHEVGLSTPYSSRNLVRRERCEELSVWGMWGVWGVLWVNPRVDVVGGCCGSIPSSMGILGRI
jgi:hypothetical protein